jgi:hypothetical protein
MLGTIKKFLRELCDSVISLEDLEMRCSELLKQYGLEAEKLHEKFLRDFKCSE